MYRFYLHTPLHENARFARANEDASVKAVRSSIYFDDIERRRKSGKEPDDKP
jgi:hypothetical protein